MEAISFILSGKTAFFKKPDVNVYAYFTYSNIHKPALLGMLGAIIGLDGHNQLFMKKQNDKKFKDDVFPEFYEKLLNLKISVVPLTEGGYFTKKIQTFNNSVGYASKEQGGNLIVREQWLENPKWKILLLDDNSIDRVVFEKIKDYILKSKTEYIPYLGKNDHPASISDCKIVELEELYDLNWSGKMASLFFNNRFFLSSFPPRNEKGFLYKEELPVRLKEKVHIYEYETISFTNFQMRFKEREEKLFVLGDNTYFFF
jgi:CRISPR-associated protein Cas5h